MSEAAPTQETEVVTGTVVGTIQKASDKWQVEVLPDGKEYGTNPRRLWTKDANVVTQMGTMMGQRLSFMCGVSNWTMNDGTPVRSLWLNGFGQPGGIANPVPAQQAVAAYPVQAAPSQAPQPQAQQWTPPAAATVAQPAPTPDGRELKIHRQTATKVAAQLLKHLTPEQQTFGNLLSISERLVAYYERGLPYGDVAMREEHPGLSERDDGIPF